MATTPAASAAEGSAAEIASRVDELLERVRQQNSAGTEREAILRRLLESMHEAMAVERNGIMLANARFAELCGASGPAALAGRKLIEDAIDVKLSLG